MAQDAKGEEDEFFVDRWVDRVMADPVLRGRILKWFWLTSLAMLLLGLAFILLIFLDRSPF